jgi:hypothetical protein
MWNLEEEIITVTTTCSLIVKGPLLNDHDIPKVLNTLVGTTLAQRQPIGYTILAGFISRIQQPSGVNFTVEPQ